MEFARQFDQFHQTIVGYTVFGLVELGVAYGLGLWAIDNGNVWLYFLTFVFLGGSIQDFVKLVGKVLRDGKARRAR